MSTLTNKTALITGGSKGIGLGIAQAMAREGMKIALTSRNENEAINAAQSLLSMGATDAIGLLSDVRNYQSLQQTVSAIINKWGSIDVVIANAGVGYFASIESMSHEQWHEIIDTNLTGVFFTLQSSFEALKQSKGYFITIASLAGTNFFERGAAYNASKFGLVGFTQAAMLDMRKFEIKVSTIMPGSVATHFNHHKPGTDDEWKIQPEDIGQIVIDLLKMHPRTLPSKIEVRPSLPK